MNTGNNTAGKTAPERYVSEKAFEELPDAFQKLAELLGEDQFELVAVNEKDSQDIYVRNGEIRLVYLMNDAVESFLIFGNARMTGVYKPDYEGEILADLSRQGREYILVVHQDDSVVTLFFETLTLEKHLYDYSQIGHFWVEGYEYLRQLEYRLAILRDKYDYIGGDSCSGGEAFRTGGVPTSELLLLSGCSGEIYCAQGRAVDPFRKSCFGNERDCT